MNTMTRRCCPGCGAPAPLALGQDWCRYCREFIGVSKDMSAAVRLSSDQVKLFSAAIWALEEPACECSTCGSVGTCAPSCPADDDVVARNLMADPSWPARLEACREEDRKAQKSASIDWTARTGRYAVNTLCAVVFAVPLTCVLWTLATVMMGLN